MKRTAEQAVRDELAAAKAKLETDEKTLDRVQVTVKTALAKRTEAADVVDRAKARVKRAQAALDALLSDQLPLGAPTAPDEGTVAGTVVPSDASSSDGSPFEGGILQADPEGESVVLDRAETLTEKLVREGKLGPDSGPELVRPKSQEGRRE